MKTQPVPLFSDAGILSARRCTASLPQCTKLWAFSLGMHEECISFYLVLTILNISPVLALHKDFMIYITCAPVRWCRYFECKALHGLFAPVHKVTRLGGAMSLSTPSPMSRSLGPGLRSARERSGSQESVSSISSSASSVSRSRVRLGVTSLANQVLAHAAITLCQSRGVVPCPVSSAFSFPSSCVPFFSLFSALPWGSGGEGVGKGVGKGGGEEVSQVPSVFCFTYEWLGFLVKKSVYLWVDRKCGLGDWSNIISDMFCFVSNFECIINIWTYDVNRKKVFYAL